MTPAWCEVGCSGSDALFGLVILLVAGGLVISIGLPLWSRHRVRRGLRPYLGPRTRRPTSGEGQNQATYGRLQSTSPPTSPREGWVARHAWLIVPALPIVILVLLGYLPGSRN
jgi:hypothetical protein